MFAKGSYPEKKPATIGTLDIGYFFLVNFLEGGQLAKKTEGGGQGNLDNVQIEADFFLGYLP